MCRFLPKSGLQPDESAQGPDLMSQIPALVSILGSNLERSCLTFTHTQGSSHIATTGVLPGCRIGSDDQNTKCPQHLNALSASNTYTRSFGLPHNEGLLTPRKGTLTRLCLHM